jgi:hypothetical protein
MESLFIAHKISPGFTKVNVLDLQRAPGMSHEVRMKDFVAWLDA